MKTRIAFLTIAFASTMALPLHAQAGHAAHGAGQSDQQMMCGMQHGAMQHGAAAQMQHGGMPGMHEMMGGYASNPGMLLHHEKELSLTANQVERIKALQQTAQNDCAQHMKLAHDQHTAAAAALQTATPDVTTFEAKLKEAAQHMVQAHVALARRGVEALNLLTAEQRAKLQTLKHQEHGSGGATHRSH